MKQETSNRIYQTSKTYAMMGKENNFLKKENSKRNGPQGHSGCGDDEKTKFNVW
jgi:hypothetical protein